MGDNVKVLGVGGAGSNATDHLFREGFSGVELIVANTDVRALHACATENRIALGQQLTRGLGAGGDPELGRAAVDESFQELSSRLAGSSLVFVLAGLGGGTGSGSAPRIVEVARGHGAQVVVLATLPFSFEGKRRMEQAAESLESLRQSADLVICFENDRMSSLVDGNARIDEAFASVDALLAQAVRALASLQQRRGVLHTGLDEISSVLSGSRSMAWFGHGSASGDDRMRRAFVAAMGSPLLGSDWYAHAGGVWVCFSGGDDLRWSEVEEVMRDVHSRLPSSTRVFLGAAVDSRMGSEVSVSVIAGAAELGALVGRVEVASAGLASGSVRREEVLMPVRSPLRGEPARHQDVWSSDGLQGGAVSHSHETRATEAEPAEIESVHAKESTISSAGHPSEDEGNYVPPFESQEELRRDIGAALLKRRVAERLAAHGHSSESAEVSSSPVSIPAPQVAPVEESEPELIPVSQEPHAPLSEPSIIEESKPSVAASSNRSKATVQEQMHFETANRGRFEKTSPTMVDGEDLDVPTFMRQGLHLNQGEDKGGGGTQ